MRLLSLPPLRLLAGAAPVVLRLVVGVVMAAHGLQKLTGGPAGFGQGLLGSLGLPAPILLGWVVTLVELVGGIALILGLLTRLAALGQAVVLTGAILLVKLESGLIAQEGAGFELELGLLAGAVAVALLGPGRPSLDHLLGVETSAPAAVDVSHSQRAPARS